MTFLIARDSTRLARAVLIAVAGAVASALPSVAHAQTSAVTLPGTPAGTMLRAWLDAFNSGDSLRLEEYHRQYEVGPLIGAALNLRRQTGGLDLVTVEHTEPRHIEVTIRERSGPRTGSVVLTTPFDGSTKVATRRILWLGSNTSVKAAPIDKATRARVIEGALERLDRSYVFPEVAKQAGDSLRARLERGGYDPYTSGVGFATRLHDELRAITRDKHLSLQYSIPAPPPAGPPPPPGVSQQAQIEATNCGFVKAEVLPGGIGYLKFDFFGPPAACGPTAAAAMNFLANTRALIVDLRENGGGSPAMVSYISSYLFSRKTHLNSLWDRNTGQTNEFWTIDDVPGKKFGGEKPVYVLTAARTFSGAEEFSYNLKSLKRAVIVGETTGGGAHPVSSQRIDDHFTIAVPFARAINPITKTNWEGVGVQPDVNVPASEALATALKLIANKPTP